jgi:UDP-glucose 4-epimerase
VESALVTGGAGFLGSHVAERLLAGGLRVVVADDLSGGYRRNVPAGAEFHRGSVADAAFVDALFAAGRFDYVFHLAAHAAEVLSHHIRAHNYEVNLLGSVHLINAAVRADVRGFVFTSSIAVYGKEAPPFREESRPLPADPYGIAKLAVEHDLRAAREAFGLRSVVFRPHNVYGERQNLSDPYRNVVGIFMSQVLRGLPCTVFGDGLQTRAFSYVGEVASVIADCLQVPAAWDGTFNLGAAEAFSVLDLAEKVQQVLGRRTGIELLPARREAVHAASDHSRLMSVFGARPATSLDAGLARMADWARQIQLGPPRQSPAIEIERGLPEPWARSARGR